MSTFKLSYHALLIMTLPCLAMSACGGTDSNDDTEVADATFALSESIDCVDAFASRPFLVRLAENRQWGTEEIEAFCAEVEDIASIYADESTLTAMTIAGVGALNGESIDTAYFIGAAGYDLSAIGDWLGEVRASRAVRLCSQDAADILSDGNTLPDGFMKSCLEDTTGEAYPTPLFKVTRSNRGIESIDEASAGAGASLLIYNVPGTGTVVSFIAGRFYAQAEPPYGAFAGCGAALGFDAVAEEGAFRYICVGAEY